MNNASFLSAERSDEPVENLKVLARFIGMLEGLKRVFIPYVVMMVIAATLPQFIVWLVQDTGNCSSLFFCSTTIPMLSWQVTITPMLLVGLVLIAVIVRIVGWALFEVTGQWSARSIHRNMVSSLARVRTTFFDENPSGRLINRLVKDYDNVRVMGVIRVGDTFNSIIEVVAAASMLIFAKMSALLLVLPVIGGVFYIQQQVSLMLHRCGTQRSIRFGEVLHRETDIIEGSRCFLLYGKERDLFRRLELALSRYVQLHLTCAQIEAWGRFWSSCLTSCYTALSMFLVVLALHQGSLSLALATVIITMILRIPPLFNWFTWITAYLIESVATMRRVFEFIDLPRETEQECATQRAQAPATKHLEGDLAFDNYQMSYRTDSPLILNGLSVTFPYGKRIGIVGRTGAGKTSLVQSLYRMVYVHGGDIRIGGKSILDYDIDFVRSHFAIVPQDPYLFEGTVRSNIDRPATYQDKDLTDALNEVGLDFKLDHQIIEGGKNLSLGERQLLCLARVLITKRPYVIMDEPTSGVDTITDVRIQEILAKKLSDRTVLTIAHRLDTLARYDLIVELKEGKLSRVGRPEELMGEISGVDLG